MLEGAEVAMRDETDDLALRHHGHVAEAAILHQAKRVHGVVAGRQIGRFVGHHGVEMGMGGVAALGEQADHVAAGEDALEVLLVVHHHNGADAIGVHFVTGALHGGAPGQRDGGAP